jgi:hypothetical protein
MAFIYANKSKSLQKVHHQRLPKILYGTNLCCLGVGSSSELWRLPVGCADQRADWTMEGPRLFGGWHQIGGNRRMGARF